MIVSLSLMRKIRIALNIRNETCIRLKLWYSCSFRPPGVDDDKASMWANGEFEGRWDVIGGLILDVIKFKRWFFA